MIIQSTMAPPPRAISFGAQSDRPERAATRLWLRNDWLAVCTTRLTQLRPGQDALAMASMAREMWLEVAAFDPVIAAEMEYETWLAGDQADVPAAPIPDF